MNQGYLQGLHIHLGVADDYNTWISAVKDNDDYLKGLHGHLGVKDNYDVCLFDSAIKILRSNKKCQKQNF